MLIGAPAGLFALISNPEAAAALLIAFMAMVAAMIVMATAIFTVLIPSELRSMCMAVWFALATLSGLGVAPVAVSVLSEFLASQMGRALSSFGTTMAILGSGAFGWAALRLHLESTPKETASA